MFHYRTLCLSILSFILIFSLIATPVSGYSRSQAQVDLAAVDAFLQETVRANRIPGVAVAIVQGDQVIFSKGYGEARPGEPVTPRTRFYIGSTTKSFTALAAMQLVEQGKLELDAPVQRYLPWFQVANPEASSTITVRHLLNHTSGLSERGDPHASAYTSSLEEQGRLLSQAGLTAPVGAQFQYYNQNYRLVGLLIEKVSGQPFGEYLQANVFKPLDMARSATDPGQAPDLAQGYSRVFGFPLPQEQTFIPGGLPSGYMITTAEDMAKFLLAQINDRKADGSPLLTSQSLATMRTPPAGIDSEYGMGWLVTEGGNTLAHGGALEYFQSFMAIGLRERQGLVILYNQNSMENMLLENNAIRNGLLDLLNGKTPQQISYSWIGWALLALATADLLNHVRLFWKLPRWAQKASSQNSFWPWVGVLAGIILPLLVVFGLPLLVKAVEGGAPNWSEPLRLMPDLTVWMLLGMGLNLIYNLLRATVLLRRGKRLI